MVNVRFLGGSPTAGFALVLAAGLTLTYRVSGQSAPTSLQQVAPLKLQEPIEAELRGGQTLTYRIQAEAGQFFHVAVLQEGIDVAVTVFDPAGKQLAQSDVLNGAYGPELVSAVAETSGEFRVDVSCQSKQSPAGGVKVELSALRPPSPADRDELAAERTYMEGAQFAFKEEAESKRIAAAKFEASARLWQTLGDSYEQGLALHSLAYMEDMLGESQQALTTYQQAAVVRHAANDKDGEAATLRNVGWLYANLGDNQKALDCYALALPLFREAGDQAAEATLLMSMGVSHTKLKDDQRAIDEFNQALSLRRATNDRKGQAETFNNMGKSYKNLGEKQKALDNYNQAEFIYHELGDTEGEAFTLSNIAALYYAFGEASQALEYYSRAIPLWHQIGLVEDEAVALNDLCEVYRSTGQIQKALDCFDQDLSLRRAAGDRRGEAITLNNMSLIYSTMGKEQNALDSSTQALTLFRATGDRKNEAVMLGNMGSFYDILGQKERALDDFQQALLIQKQINDADGIATTKVRLGMLDAEEGEPQKALENFTEALQQERAQSNLGDEASTLNNIAQVYNVLGERKKALDYTMQALDFYRTVHDQTGEASGLNNAAMIYENLGDPEKALKYFDQALPAFRAVGDARGEAVTLNNIGMIYGVLAQREKALDYFNQGLAITRAIGDRDHEALSLTNIGEIYSMGGDLNQALEHFSQALPIARAVANRTFEGQILIHLGETYAKLSRGNDALDRFNQALSILRQTSDRDGETSALNDLGKLYSVLGDKQKAIDYFTEGLAVAVQVNNPLIEAALCHGLMLNERENPPLAIYYGKQAINFLQRMRGNIQGLDMELQRSFLTNYQETYRDLARQLIDSGRLAEAQQVLDLLKEREYSDYVRGEKVDAGSLLTLTPAEQQAQQDYQKSTAELISLGQEWGKLKKIAARTPEQETQYQQLSSQLDAASKGLNDYYARLYVLFGKNSDANKQIADVKGNVSLLKQTIAKAPHTVALYTMVTTEGYKVIVITGSAIVEREYNIAEKDLNQTVAAFQQVLRQPSRDPKPLAQQLYNILIEPVKADLDQAQARTLVFSLDGVLRYLPMAALYDGKQYLIQNYSTVTITPVSIPHLAEKPDISNLNTVAMGISQKYENGLPPLPSVVGELDEIVNDARVQGAQGVLPGTILLDSQFTEKAMEDELGSPRGVVHIASHFVFEPGDDSQSYLLLSGKEQGGTGFHLTVADFRDNQKLGLDDTELLTLSACETGMGGDTADGREVDGLGTTAQLKGARAVISSLWEVNDASTGELMADFYKRWVSGAGKVEKVEALRQAQLDLLQGKAAAKSVAEGRGLELDAPAANLPESYAHPYYWAPFVLMGNWK